MSIKKCPKCGIQKDIKDFCKDRTRKDELKTCCKMCDKLHGKQWRSRYPEKKRQSQKQWKLNNKDKIKIYELKNKDRIIVRINANKKKRAQYDVNFRIMSNCRRRIHEILRKKHKKSAHSIDLIGCSAQELAHHIENQWQSGMSWDNYGLGRDKWNIHHIIPCCFFDMSDPVEQHMCFNFSNTQPLWQLEHAEKHRLEMIK